MNAQNSVSASANAHPPTPWSGKEIRILATIMLINIIDGLDNQILPLSIGPISQDLGVAAADFSGAVSAGFLGAALGTPLGGWLGDKWGRKPGILFGMLIFGLFTLSMYACVTPGQFTIVRLLAGIGLGMCLPPMLALVVESVTDDKRGTAIALTMLSMPLGLTLSGIIIPRLQLAIGWQNTFLYCGLLVLAVAAFSLFSLREPERDRPDSGDSEATEQSLTQRISSLLSKLDLSVIVALTVSMFLVYIAMSAALSWLPAFAFEQGLSQTVSGQAIAFWSFSGMVGTVLSGWAANRLGGIRAAKLVVLGFAIAGLLAGAMLLLVGNNSYALYASAALGGLLASGTITVLYAATAERVPSAIRSSGVSAVTLAGKSGGVVGGASGVVMLTLPSLAGFFAVIGAIAAAGWLSLLWGTKSFEKSDLSGLNGTLRQ